MSEISAGLKKTIKEVKRLADGDQLIACKELLQEKRFPYGNPKPEVNESIIRELLPTIIKFMESNDHVLQTAGADFVISITHVPNEKVNTKLLIDAGLITKLVNLLSSPNTDVLISTLKAFVCIAEDFPEMVIENEILRSMIQCLKSENPKISYQASRFIYHISFESEERINAVFEAGGVKPLIEILETKNNRACEVSLDSLINITSFNPEFRQRFFHLGGLKSLKKLCDRLLVVKKDKKQYTLDKDLKSLRERKIVKLLALRLIKYVTSYGEAQVNLVIQENFIPLILQQIKGGMTPQIKIESIKVIENIIAVKRDFIPALVQNYNIFLFCYSNLGSSNADLVISTLTAMRNIVENFDDKDNIRQKIRKCGGPTKLSNLCKHSNEEVRHLSTMLYEFVFDVKPDPLAGVSGESNQQEPELLELDSEDDDNPVIENPQTRYQRKRHAYTQPVGPLRRSKRFKVSLEQTEIENSESSSNDDESDNDQNNDFDDHPINSSPPVAAPTESNPNDHSGRHSFVGSDTVATNDGPSRLNPKEERPPTPPNVDIPATSASRQPLDLPVAASTNNETVQNEMKPLTAGRLGNRSRRASNNSHVKLEAASTNDGNIRDNDVGRQIAVDSETAATADENIRNDIKPLKQSPVDGDTSAIAPALPAAAASTTNDGTMPDEIVKYWRPAEFLVHQYCGTLEIQFNRKDYDEFIPKIEFTQITSNSKPDAVFQPIDQTGFGCFSILLTGNEEASSAIRMKINKKFVDNLRQSGQFDEEKITKVISRPYLMKEEHFETIAAWLKCRILVYCNGWKKYGSWETEDQMIPVFVLEKKKIDGKTEYCIVLTLKND